VSTHIYTLFFFIDAFIYCLRIIFITIIGGYISDVVIYIARSGTDTFICKCIVIVCLVPICSFNRLVHITCKLTHALFEY